VGPDLELISGLLVNVWSTQNTVLVDNGRQRDRTGYAGTGSFSRIDDLTYGDVQELVVICLKADSDLLVLH
jgi:hypothetical protein